MSLTEWEMGIIAHAQASEVAQYSPQDIVTSTGVPRWRTMEGHTFVSTLRNQRFRQVACPVLDTRDPEGASRV